MEDSIKKPRKPRIVKPPDPDTGGFVQSMPTNWKDLVGLWDIPDEAIQQAKLKIGRSKLGTRQTELVADICIQEYSLEMLAREFGPGLYFLVLNPGPRGAWPARNARITVSSDYARSVGFSAFGSQEPAPFRIAEMRSVKEATQSQNLGQSMTPESLAQLIEMVSERTAAKLAPQQQQQQGTMESMMMMFKFFSDMQKSSMETAFQMAGMQRPESLDEEKESDSWLGIAKELAPVVRDVAGAIFRRDPQTRTVNPAEPIETPEREEIMPQITIPISKEEAAQFAGAVALLQPFTSHISDMLGRVSDGAELAEELASYIPERLDSQIVALAKLGEERGKEVLGIIHPKLATEKGLQALKGIKDYILAAGDE
jgi:hypothetical protein